MSTRTITLSPYEIQKLQQRFAHAEKRKTPPYAEFQLKLSDCIVTAYTSGKVVFQGEQADVYADAYDASYTKPSPTATTKATYPQCGSDEVGTGDYFGPVTVCAAYVKESDVALLRELGIQDSKAVDDTTIRKVAPVLCERLTYSLLVLDNNKYNEIHPQYNMVAIKTRLHNQAYVHLRKKLGKLPSFCVIDQFVQASSYYRYLNDVPEVVRGIHFETKAENKYLAVAAASIIARYAFLQAFDKMSEHYDFPFLKGAGAKVDDNIRDFVKQHGKQELQQVAKLHFANTNKALG